MKNETVTLHVVPHTHWDREWYFTLEEFRYRLIKLMDILLEEMTEDRITWFTLDGQTIMLEDYLTVRPEKRDTINDLVENGRIQTGPWYTQPNVFMSDAESQIRNLLMGKKETLRYGGREQTVNYMPDQFGFNTQLPQIMSEFNLTHLVGWRGLPYGCHTYFNWRGADRTEVKVCALIHDYGNAYGLSDREIPRIFEMIFGESIYMPSLAERLEVCLSEKAGSISPQLLAMNGIDHMYPNTSMKETLEKIKEEYIGVKPVQSNLCRYIEAVESTKTREPETYEGELRDPRIGCVLPASQSMRMDVKKYNRRMEQILERQIEPLICLAAAAGEEKLPYSELDYAWRILLENHAHDSLCCSNSDPSYREIMVRYDKVGQIADEIAGELYQRLIRRIDGGKSEGVLFVNPSLKKRNGRILVDIAVSPKRKFLQPHLYADGRELETYYIGKRKDSFLKFVPFTGRIGDIEADVFTLAVNTGDIPGSGFAYVEIRGGGEHEVPEKGLADIPGTLENEFLRAWIDKDGNIGLLDKRTGREYTSLNGFISEGEAGNGFEHTAPQNDSRYVCGGDNLTVTVKENDPLRGVLEIRRTFTVPSSLSEDGKSRSGNKAVIVITTQMILTDNAKYIEFITEIDNTAKDHRLRVVFPTDIKSDRSFAKQPFDIVERQVKVPKTDYADYTGEKFQPYHPMLDFCGTEDGKTGAAVCGEGFTEYEILPERNTIAVTLIRATEKLYSGVLERGSKFRIEDAQLLKKMSFRYAFIPFEGTREKVEGIAEAFLHPVIYVQRDFLEDESMPKHMEAEAVFETKEAFITAEGGCVTGAVKPSEDRRGLILRIYNPSDKAINEIITVGEAFEVSSAEYVKMNEETISSAHFEDNAEAIIVGPKKIISLKFIIKIRE